MELWIATAALGIINVLIALILNHILQAQRAQAAILREIEIKLFPREEFHRYEDQAAKRRHDLGERVTALEIRAGEWKTP